MSAPSIHPLATAWNESRRTLHRKPYGRKELLPCLAPVRFPCAFHRCRNRLFVPRSCFLAALDQIVRALPLFPRFLLCKILALIVLVCEKAPRLITTLLRDQHYHPSSHSHPH